MPPTPAEVPSPRPSPGRRLKAPQMHYVPNLSLARLMTQYLSGKETTRPLSNVVVPQHGVSDDPVASGMSAGRPSQAPSRAGKKHAVKSGAFSAIKRALRQEPPAQARLSDPAVAPMTPKRSPMSPASSEASFGAKRSLTLSTPVPKLSLATPQRDAHDRKLGDFEAQESEYERKRAVHPRLRWLRMAKGGDDPYLPQEDSTPLPNAVDATSADEKTDDGKVIPGVGGPALVLGGPKQGKAVKSFQYSTQRSPRGKGLQPRPCLLPQPTRHQESPAGVVSTLHSTVLFAEVGDHSENLLSASSMSLPTLAHSMDSKVSLALSNGSGHSIAQSCGTSKMVDRKWFMRMAPISCLPSEPASKSARRAAAAQGHASPFEGGDGGEYLTFERWGLSDDYVESLLNAHCRSGESGLRGLRHLNLSENRLTENGVKKLMGYGLPESLLSLSLASNGLGDRGGRAAILLIMRCRRLRQLDLSNNDLGDQVAEELCSAVTHLNTDLEGLGLSCCGLGASPKAGIAVGSLLSLHKNVKSLDLSWNALQGEGAHAFLKGLHDNSMNGSLRRLNLAWNRLGSGHHDDPQRKDDAERCAKLFARVFRDGSTLFHLDLSYNGFVAEGCAIMAAGLRNNHTLFGIHLVGNEAAMDDLGFVIPLNRKPEAPPEAEGEIPPKLHALATPPVTEGGETNTEGDGFASREEHQRWMNEYVRSVPSGLKLDHPQVMRTGLSKLHHNPSLRSLEPDSLQPFSQEDLNMEKGWMEDVARVQTTADWVKRDFTSLDRNANCCWICENWVEHKITYIPTFSGSEGAPEDVQSVFALFSIDGFTRPTKLKLQEESRRKSMSQLVVHNMKGLNMVIDQDCQKRIAEYKESKKIGVKKLTEKVQQPSQERQGSPAMQRAGTKTSQDEGSDVASDGASTPAPPPPPPPPPSASASSLRLNSHGKVSKWVGVRMLPPTKETINVAFLVNGKVKTANDMPRHKLAVPKVVTIQAVEEDSQVTIEEVNSMTVGTTAWELFRRGRHHAVCVLEDPANRNEVTLMPRQLTDMSTKDIADECWQFEKSSFKDYMRDAMERNEQCFDRDWNYSRLVQIMKKDETRNELCAFLRPRYLHVMVCYWNLAFSSFDDRTHSVGLSSSAFREHVIAVGGQGYGKLIDGNYCKTGDPDCIFVAANVIDKAKRAQFKILPEKGLARFQFLESIVRLAFRRNLQSTPNHCTTQECVKAVSNLFSMMSLGEDIMEIRRTLHEALFTQECCETYKEHIETLKGVYDGYKTVCSHPGRSGKFISYGAWLELMVDACVVNEHFTMKMCGEAFALAKEIRVDITSDWRHMELSWGEFLVALAAVVRLHPDWDAELLADLMDEFFTEHIDEAYSKLLNRQPGKGVTKTISMKSVDPHMRPLIDFLRRVFEDADEDTSGAVDLREFKKALTPPPVKQELHRIGLNVSEFDILFRTIATDGRGEVTVDELVNGFVRMKSNMRGLEKAIPYVRKAFAEVDKSNMGWLDIGEVVRLFEQPTMVKKLGALGIGVDDVADLVEMVEEQDTPEVTIEVVLHALVSLRDPVMRVKRGLRTLRQLFDEADADGSGSLDMDEVQESLMRPEVEEKFQHMHLAVPNWTTLFEELDIDGSGDLDWEEVEAGMTAYWATRCHT